LPLKYDFQGIVNGKTEKNQSKKGISAEKI
jgi:hypothetical protein